MEGVVATFHRNVPSEDKDAPGVANLIVLAALGDFVFALPTLYPWADAAFFIVLRSRLASSLIAGLVVFFFKDATVFPHLVDLRRSSVMADSGTPAIPRKISSILASLGSTSFALTSAIVYSLSSRAARVVMCLAVLLFKGRICQFAIHFEVMRLFGNPQKKTPTSTRTKKYNKASHAAQKEEGTHVLL